MKYVANKLDHIIGKFAKNYWKTYHKFGIRVPKTLAEALQIDKETGTGFWKILIEKEVLNVQGGFQET